jgi:gluconolactonase
LWAISPEKKVTVLVNGFEGKNFNGPNDVWVNRLNGDMYFTDPYYKRNYWEEGHTHMDEQRVYYLAKGTNHAVIADDKIIKPNGIVGTADGKYLYVADIEGNKTYKYTIGADGSLSNKTLFVSQGSDGMTLDNEGNVYLTGHGVTVYNPKGEKIHHFNIPENWTGNVCFGGKDKNILFITASKSIYIVHMNVHGIN